ncbi:hypothetical protein [Haloflavibacter putidus]|uniref:DUF4369 domain-containing protein n=1 Tax=Haloflavibacter putidus TaxID=2576776 RepID=A0A507ZJV3_9FLAO|nr:hypothetical protein [Haloflavibacter putidus]TQD34002.1 hypothetical protein FKR84_12330 [Haloflavibacter putidus]
MKNLFLAFIILSLVGCNEQTNHNLKDLNFYIESYKDLDSLEVSDVSNYEQYRLTDFEDPYLSLDFKRKINDLYTVVFYAGEKKYIKRLWLDGNQPVISVNFDKSIEIDSVKNSSLYYQVSDYSKKLGRLYESKTDDESINAFLLAEIEKHINSPFSFSVAQIYKFRNKNDTRQLKKLQDLLAKQPDSLHRHSLYQSIKKDLP